MEDRLLDVSAVSKRLNVSPGTVRNYLRDPWNPLRGVKIGNSIRIFSSSVDKLLKEGEKALIEL